MYAVVRTGGKQYRVVVGQTLEVERLTTAANGEITFEPLLVVDGDRVAATPSEIGKATVTAKVVGDTKGPKITGYTYKNKSNQSKRWGHRQKYSVIEITKITTGGSAKTTPAKAASAEATDTGDEA